MHFSFTPEQREFREVLRRFLAAQCPPAAVRRVMTTVHGHDETLWRRLHDDLGLPALHLPEALGGGGFGQQELGLAIEELGRALAPVPFLSSAVLATQALVRGATAVEQAALLPALANGTTTATLAWMEGPHWDGCADVATVARRHGDAWLLDGDKSHVVDGHSAAHILVVAREAGTSGDEGIGLWRVAEDAPGFSRRPLATIDTTRRLAALAFAATPARRLDDARECAAIVARVLDDAAVALAHELIGCASALLDASVEYAKLRMQFGRPIGSFQAIKHKCARLLLELELARAAVYYAAAARDAGDADAAALAAQAKAQASDAALDCAREAVQIHGGIGFTWDHDTHLWFKRATSAAVLLGDAAWHRERFLALTEAAA
ncbi:MAG: acyl-CoA dehydrogenase family protein [Gammaproteobacteria bacterium]